MGRAMEVKADKVLLPFAHEVADQVGLAPAGFEIGRGMRKLGHCTAKKVIQLSRNLMFLSEPLVRYIICHELAHLTHMNHSPQFHALCDKYCNGQEKALERQLRQFRFPIVK
jgi:predicted metal-dependent hydrolase